MKQLNLFVFSLVLLVLFLFLQESGIMSWWGVKANFLLVVFMLFVAARRPPLEISLLALFFLGFVFFENSLWFLEAALFVSVVAVSLFARKVLTGRFFLDFIILTVFSTALFFYLPVFVERIANEGFSFLGLSFSPYSTLFIEVVMNLIIALAFTAILSHRKLSEFFR